MTETETVPNEPGVLVAEWAPNGCPSCRYDLRGNAADRCPECGTALAAV